MCSTSVGPSCSPRAAASRYLAVVLSKPPEGMTRDGIRIGEASDHRLHAGGLDHEQQSM